MFDVVTGSMVRIVSVGIIVESEYVGVFLVRADTGVHVHTSIDVNRNMTTVYSIQRSGYVVCTNVACAKYIH